jgi:uncharacterized coiled-coil protein SlyX
MSVSASRRKRARSEKIDDDVEIEASGADGSPGGEMKQMQPRRGEGPYSMMRLERAVTRLVEGQGALIARIEALENALADRDRLVEELEARVKSSDEKRANALERIDRLIDELDELEGRAESAAFPVVDTAPNVEG